MRGAVDFNLIKLWLLCLRIYSLQPNSRSGFGSLLNYFSKTFCLENNIVISRIFVPEYDW